MRTRGKSGRCRAGSRACASPPRWTHRAFAARMRHPAPSSDALSYRRGKFWQPDVTVACVVVRDGCLLMVEEQVGGQVVLNQPAGHLEPDESLFDAARRETLEETGWHVDLTAFIGAYQWKAPDDGGQDAGRHYLR